MSDKGMSAEQFWDRTSANLPDYRTVAEFNAPIGGGTVNVEQPKHCTCPNPYHGTQPSSMPLMCQRCHKPISVTTGVVLAQQFSDGGGGKTLDRYDGEHSAKCPIIMAEAALATPSPKDASHE